MRSVTLAVTDVRRPILCVSPLLSHGNVVLLAKATHVSRPDECCVAIAKVSGCFHVHLGSVKPDTIVMPFLEIEPQ